MMPDFVAAQNSNRTTILRRPTAIGEHCELKWHCHNGLARVVPRLIKSNEHKSRVRLKRNIRPHHITPESAVDQRRDGTKTGSATWPIMLRFIAYRRVDRITNDARRFGVSRQRVARSPIPRRTYDVRTTCVSLQLNLQKTHTSEEGMSYQRRSI